MTFGTFIAAAITATLAAACGGSTATVAEITAPDVIRCQTSISTNPPAFPHGGSQVTLTVVAGRECAWTINSESPWVRVSPTTGQGEAPVTLTVSSNPDASVRTGSVLINNTRLSLTQEAAPCRFQLGSSQGLMSHDGGRTTVSVSTANGCAWRATSSAQAWLRVLTDSGTGSGTVEIEASANPGGERSATITIADQAFTLVQESRASTPQPPPPLPPPPPPAPGCSVSLDSAERSFGASGGEGSIRVTAPGTCAWSASASAPWIELAGSGGSGNDTVRYTVAANTSTSARTGTITIGGRTHTVRQDAAPTGGGGGGGGGGEERIELEGRALLVDGSCPNISFLLGLRRIFTNGDTNFRGGCGSIRNGTEVRVEGRVQSDGRVRATSIRVRDDD